MNPETGWYFDDFEVGQRFEVGTRHITKDDLEQFTAISGDAHPIHWDEEYCRATPFGRPILHGPFGIALTFGLLHDHGLFGDAVVAMRSVSWDFLRPMFVGDDVTLSMTITRCRVSSRGTSGTVHRWLELVNQHGETVQAGTSPVLLQRGAQEPSAAPAVGLDFATLAWARAVADRLHEDDEFRDATATFDGAIGFRAGDETVSLRIYHGRIVECVRRTDAARRFVIAGTEAEWVDFVFASRNDFIARATRGQFEVEGDTYEYLRLTKAVHCCWRIIRALADESRRGDGR
jgi:acyl dehydratase